MVEFNLTEEFKALGISKVVKTDSNLYIYNGKSFVQSRFYKNELQKTFDELKDKMTQIGSFGDRETVEEIIKLLSEVWVKSEEANQKERQQRQQNKTSQNGPKEFFIHKYSKDIPLSEEISLGNRNVFLQIIDGELKILDKIDLSKERGLVLKPHHSAAIYEYKYDNTDEIKKFIDIAEKIQFNDLYFLVKSIWKDIVVPNEKELIPLLAADTIVSYFQDLFITQIIILS